MTLDLSAVTDSLIGLVKSQWNTAPIWAELGAGPKFNPTFTGLAPDAAYKEDSPRLSLYLYHVEPDNVQEALRWRPQQLGAAGGQSVRFLPLALDLFYLVFAHSDKSYTEEQEAMSVALRIFHANPVVRSAPGAATPWELTLTMEHRSYDELSRLWQATTAALRMSVVYRAAVVFIDPDTMPRAAKDTSAFSVTASPVGLPLPGPGGDPVLFGTFRHGAYLGPAGEAVPFSQSPAILAAGQATWLLGSNLGVLGLSDRLYLVAPASGAEVDVTAWVAAAESSAARFVLTLPAAAAAPPAGAPAPGLYQLRVGSGAPGSPGARRSDPVPVSIAAQVDPSAGPVLAGPAPFTVNGAGFVPGATEVLAGTVTLTEVKASPGPGEVSISPSGTSFSFTPPAGVSGTVVPVRVRAGGVESDPALWVTL
jgi:Pvc16 N-terminal domain